MTEPGSAAAQAQALLAELLAGAPADPAAALQQLAQRARDRALVVLPLGLQPATEARELASLHAAIALQSVRHGRPMAPTVLASAGPVLCDGAPTGAADFLLALALSLDENPLIHAAACEAASPAAGPVDRPNDPRNDRPADSATDVPIRLGQGYRVGPDTVRRSRAAGRPPGPHLLKGEAPALLAALGDAFVTDARPEAVLRVILICME